MLKYITALLYHLKVINSKRHVSNLGLCEKNREKQKNLGNVNHDIRMQFMIYIDRYNYNVVARVTYIYISLTTGSEGD